MPNKQQPKPTEMELKPSAITLERNRYFTGKYMTARDFRAEQDYFLTHQRSHMRMLHGWGILCGLEIERHWNVDCQDRWLKVKSGVAFDCYGREIDVKEAKYVELPLPPQRPKDAKSGVKYVPPQGETIYSEPFFLCLEYTETCIDQVAALTGEHCDPAHMETNRVREGYCFVFKTLNELDGDCWKTTKGSAATPCRDDCDDEKPGPYHTCLDANCECGRVVPLALITPNIDAEGYLSTSAPWFTVDTKGRHELPVPPDYLTHIVWTSWPHGGKMKLSELRERKGRLEVRFDRKLLKTPVEQDEGKVIGVIGIDVDADGDVDVVEVIREYDDDDDDDKPVDTGIGINSYTFAVQSRSKELEREGDFVWQFVPYEEGVSPHIEGENDHVAVYTIDRKQLEGYSNLGGKVVHITLKCDFILDCHENPVDGNHLRGRLPSGDGVPGGNFESWFYVVDDWEEDEDDRKRKRRQHEAGAK